ncbi:hypothetical protein L3N51_02162 [Metallosphaera sp. J1]|uniref:hypothetical protein n=1 Tax=Metallosphaera TaxID=41980 RepID=UPI001EDE7966|nr:hypothetical protein [Metallosphaera javensis (ex Hofmann et al. 2022)]MCG3109865.1 hypothetical protein [Metallosphaera javensis (ex Hofmann et al. 2022)]BCS92121.1 MAG: hypothetical protein MjAS7_0729 [Metallosphaera javensis (ex Sakai et al. 2022)]
MIISARSAQKIIYSTCKKLKVGNGLRIESYKRDRFLEIYFLDHDKYKIIESGYNRREFEISGEQLKDLLREVLSIEFPRSHILYLSEIT